MSEKEKKSENSQESRKVQAGQDYFEQIGGNVFTGSVYIQGQAGQGAETSRPKVFHNLPQPDYGRFVGRETELQKLRELLSPKSRHFVITIDGIVGQDSHSFMPLTWYKVRQCLKNLDIREIEYFSFDRLLMMFFNRNL